MTQFITCPSCAHHIHLEDALAQHLEARLKSELADRSHALEQREHALLETQRKQEALLAQRIQEREAQARRDISAQLSAEYQQRERQHEEELSQKTRRISELLANEADLRRKQRTLEEERAALALEVEKRVATELAGLEVRAREDARQEAALVVEEKEILIRQLKYQVDDMTRKMQQRSTQVQGEAQELALEHLLRATHPGDGFEEIRKGELGADLAQEVRNPFGRSCGVILYESKRTKAFHDDWIGKLRHDMQLRRADLGVLVTQTLPKGVTQFELRDENIYICTFAEVKALSYCLRASLIRVEEVRVVQTHQGDKSRLLYQYLTGSEFRNQLQLIHGTFQTMHSNLAREKQAALRRYKQREKELEKVLGTFAEVVGSLNGIAGHTVVEFADFELVDPDPYLIE